MKPKDYLHLYLGCLCLTDDNRIGHLAGIDVCEPDKSITMLTVRFIDVSKTNAYYQDDDWSVYNDNEEMDRVKLILRPLSEMTKEEAIDLCRMQIKGIRECDDVKIIEMKPCVKFIITHKDNDHQEELHCVRRYLNIESYLTNQFIYLISKGFDIFNLLDNPKLAITQSCAMAAIKNE